jgi:alginate O-acetyltransferase complex protein AlgI
LYFDAPYALTLGEAWAAALCFSFQIYYDFSAYSDMAVGIGLLFGYELRRNFLTPYVAADPAEFWRRWHVTLSEWIRDYVYIPLGGNRGRYLSASTTLMIAMLASGLWHGANATFVLWGAWHGLLLVGHRVWRARPGAQPAGTIRRNLSRVGLFGLVTLGWVLFRAPDVDAAAAMLLTMLDPAGLGTLASVKKLLALAAGLYALHALEAWVRTDEVGWGRWWIGRTPWPLQGLAYAAIALALMATYPAAQAFIYFRF